ncbi:MAG: PD-(D/E)XK nuclease family protein [Planctomycetota bacterium]|jgi:ATP-dependent helicase/DNAse subunit B
MHEKYLILGRAGSGKTGFVLDKFYGYVKKSSTDKVVFLLPTYSQAEHLKDVIIRTGPVRGFVDNSIFTFSQLARKILDVNVAIPGRVVGELEKDFILKKLLGENPPKYLTKDSWDYGGLRRALLRLFKELKEDSTYPADFKARIDLLIGKGGSLPSADSGKYQALLDVYSRFQKKLEGEGLCDEDDVLNAALKVLEDNVSVFSEKETLIVDGFHSFTPVEFRLLGVLAQRVPNVYISLAYDPKTPGSPVFQGSTDVYSQLRHLGLKEMPLGAPERFSASGTLAHVERNLFARTPDVADTDTGNDLEVLAAANIEDEVKQMAHRIYKMVSREDYRFSDIGIILRDPTPYYQLIETTFARYGIPVRLYVERPLMESPIIAAILFLARVFTSHWRDRAGVLRSIKSSYVKYPENGAGPSGRTRADLGKDKDIDQFEREALRRGIIEGSDGWLKLAQELELSGVRLFLEKLIGLEKGMSGAKPARAFSRWFVLLIDECMVFTGATDPSCAGLVRREAQALRSFLSVMDSMVHIMGERPVTFSHFVEELSYNITASSYSLKDKRRDVVNVIDVLEARQWELPVVFVGGLLERQFPRQARENLFLDDRDRRRLRETAGAHLKEFLKTTGEEERFLFYVALTRAKRGLFLSYPAADSRGNPNLPSFFLREVKRLFSPGCYQKIMRQRTHSDFVPEAKDILTRKDMRDFVCYHLNTPYRSGSKKEGDHVQARALYNEARTGAAADLGLVEDLKVALGTPVSGNMGTHRGLIEQIFPSYRATQFRDLAQCPFLHFARYVLRLKALKSLAEEGLNPARQGEIIHETLMRYYERKAEGLAGAFEDIFARNTRGIRIGLNELRIKDEMFTAAEALIEEDRRYEAMLPFRPAYLEKKFGYGSDSTLEIQDAVHGTIRIRGRIDRIDEAEIDGKRAGLILDYKYSKTGLTKSGLKKIEDEGVDLQLPIYMMAARECLNLTPLGAQLYQLKPPERSGILDARVKQMAPSLPAKGAVLWTEDEIESFLEHSKMHIRRYVGRVLAGDSEVSPRDLDRCEEGKCEFLDVCRFEKWSGGKKEGRGKE